MICEILGRHVAQVPSVLNIDTSRIRQIACQPAAAAARDIVRLLQTDDHYLVVCLTRVHELARSPHTVRANVIALLRDVHTLIGQSDDVLEEDELACGCARATGRHRRSPRPFSHTTSEWGTANQAPNYTAADLVALQDPTAPEVLLLKEFADAHVSEAKRLGTAATISSDRTAALRGALQRHLSDWRQRDAAYADRLSADDIIERAGGIAAFPCFYVAAELFATRLARPRTIEGNDLLDEEIAKHHGYCTVSVLDSSTKGRFWKAGISGRERVTDTLDDIQRIVDRVQRGDFPVSDFHLPAK